MPEQSPAAPPSDRVRLRRHRERAAYGRDAIDAILDEALIAHLGICDEAGQPFVVPTLHARAGDVVYCHGSAAGRATRALAASTPACLTVTLIDGLVMARAVANHSANYRSVMLLGRARPVEEREEKLAALEAVTEHIAPGRWGEARLPSDSELREVTVVALPLDEASAKIRVGPPTDDEGDYALDVWAGVLPFHTAYGPPEPCPRLADGIAVPASVAGYSRP
ncbi:MAG TPA: pyridoxamine 5'-phosphate oxidase family protein [Solirubrobacteraceae bacterium]|nr:pyridoxamine 5'-phosphate oxidase family protein [Solirubrobacteraceae bacterium]